jgi:hypothetical protein
MWDYAALAAQARHDIGEIRPLLEEVLDASLLAGVVKETSSPQPYSDDELWVRIVYAFAAAARRGQPGNEHLAGMVVPLYLWRAAAFMAQAAHQPDEAVQEGLESLCQTFLRLKPVLATAGSPKCEVAMIQKLRSARPVVAQLYRRLRAVRAAACRGNDCLRRGIHRGGARPPDHPERTCGAAF